MDPLPRSEFWQQAAALAFGAWAIFLPIAAGLVVRSISKFRAQFDDWVREFGEYVVTTERRLTFLETEHKAVMEQLRSMRENGK